MNGDEEIADGEGSEILTIKRDVVVGVMPKRRKDSAICLILSRLDGDWLIWEHAREREVHKHYYSNSTKTQLQNVHSDSSSSPFENHE